jgi:Glycosyltransferase family 87
MSRCCCIVALLLALAAVALAPSGRSGHDYIQFHAAATLLRAGENPYAFVTQARAQSALRAADAPRAADPTDAYDAIGVLPYFYPPWLALCCVPLTALSYPVARAAWVALGAVALGASGFGLTRLRATTGRVTVSTAVALALGLMPCYACVRLGQTPPLVIVGLVAALCLLERGHDRAAGAALAWAVVKPQLAVVAVPAALLWAGRRGRWGVLSGFSATLAALSLSAALIVPDWPVEMLRAPSRIPLPTTLDPSVGVTWLAALRTCGAAGIALWSGYLLVALPAALLALRAAWHPAREAADAVSLGVLASFFVAPYALGYDLAVLVVPLVVLLPRLSPRAMLWTLTIAAVVPYWHLSAVNAGLWQVTFLVWPVALAGLYFTKNPRWVESATPPTGDG